MGEIIIKVPEDIHEVIDLGLPYKKIKEKLEEIEKDEELVKNFLSIKLNKEIKKKSLNETEGDFYEAIFEIND